MHESDAVRAPGAERAVMMLLAGAVAGLCLAGVGLFNAPTAAANALANGELVRVKQGGQQGVILMSDFRQQAEALYDIPFAQISPSQRKAVLDDMITEELLVQRGLEIGLPSSTAEVREALVGAVRQQSTAQLDAKAPTEAQLRDYYAAHRDRYLQAGSMRVHDLVLPFEDMQTRAAATRTAALAADALRRGQDMAAVVARFGLRANPLVNGDDMLEVAVRRQLGDALYAAADGLHGGETSLPLQTDKAVHIIACSARTRPVARGFEAVREQVGADYLRDAKRQAQQAYVSFLKEKATVIIAPQWSAPAPQALP